MATALLAHQDQLLQLHEKLQGEEGSHHLSKATMADMCNLSSLLTLKTNICRPDTIHDIFCSSGICINTASLIGCEGTTVTQDPSKRVEDITPCIRLVGGESTAAPSSPYQSPPPKTSMRADQHIDEIEALRREKRDLQLHNCELEVQIQDAAHSIEGFSAAIEKLEDGYKTKEETWKRQIADLQQECDSLARTNRQLQDKVAQGDHVKDKLSKKEQALADLRAQFDAYKVHVTESTQDRKVLETTQESLRATQGALDKAEAMNASLTSKLDALKAQHRETSRALDAKTRQLTQLDATSRPQGQSVLVRTLRDEVRLLKGTLEAQFRDEKTALQQRIQSLEHQVSSLQASCRQKDDSIMALHSEALERDGELGAMADAKRLGDAKAERLERELAALHVDMEQLEECRGFLGDNIETGFKELLLQDGNTDALERELADVKAQMHQVQHECDSLRADVASLRDMNEQLRHKRAECQAQIAASETEAMTWRADAQRLPALLAEKTDWERAREQLEATIRGLQNQLQAMCDKVAATADYDTLVAKLQQAQERLDTWQHASDDRKAREKQMKQLMQRLESIGNRNGELDAALQRALAQSKQDHVDMVALRARLKASKDKVCHLHTYTSQNSEQAVARFDEMQQSVCAAEDKLRDAVTIKHMLKQQVDTLKRQVDELHHDHARQNQDDKQWQRQVEHMQSIMEGHTKELVGEIESLQRQVAKATKKADAAVDARRNLELKVHEQNATIAKLHQAVRSATTLSPKTSGTTQGGLSPSRRRREAAGRTAEAEDDNQRTCRGAMFEPDGEMADKTLDRRLAPNPADEMESLLRKLERISQQYK
ncbi:hypothetical protein DYB37_010535 [Aphanomyces astaci]|uniref:Uncharacterized protein n=1 Tax=Aphanomyces astaci TaxID=112090 RepID=A0A418E422_APHAT|nr:hypothetical protein DYB37_010535 [Aphanomyces astaci]